MQRTSREVAVRLKIHRKTKPSKVNCALEGFLILEIFFFLRLLSIVGWSRSFAKETLKSTFFGQIKKSLVRLTEAFIYFSSKCTWEYFIKADIRGRISIQITYISAFLTPSPKPVQYPI